MTHVISLLVENHQGVMARIAGLFSGRGYNMESFTAGPTLDPTVTRITLVCRGDNTVIDQITKQLNRLIDVIKVYEFTGRRTLDRELALIKVFLKPEKRAEIFQIADVFGADVMDLGRDAMVLELTGSSQKIDDLVALLQDFGIQEIARSGLVSMERAKKSKNG
jgi:acetolactate synthase I/III small subunit